MRNLKRALSLAMASVMTLGMMTVGASAKGLDFSDAAEITNVTAATITSDLGIFVGYETADGNFEFQGEKVVTRAEMAVVCAKLLYGADVDPAQFAGVNKFADVPAWAEGYVNLCASLGIIVGRDATTFDPNATVTTAEASVMLAKTLGYFKNEKDFGGDWMLAATAKATQLGLYGDLKLAADAGLTRDSVAEMAFNTMTKAVPVDYNELLGTYYNKNQGIVYALEFNYLQTLGYKNFDLVYKTVEEGGLYGRPAIVWGTGHYEYTKDANSNDANGGAGILDSNGGLISEAVRMLDKNEIIRVDETADYVYTQDTSVEQVAKDLGAKVLDWNDWTVFVNGEEQAVPVKPATVNANGTLNYAGDKDDKYTYTDKGAVLEIYIDEYEEKITLCEINYYLGEVASVKTDDNGEYVNVKALSDMPVDQQLDIKTFYTDELAKGDLVVFTVDENNDEDLYIAEMFTPGTVTGEVTRVEKDKGDDDTYIRLNGESTKYYYTSKEHNVYDLDLGTKTHPELKKEYILYTTPAGYILGFELAEETVTEYLYVEDSDEEMKDWIGKVILADASTAKVEVDEDLDVKKADATWTDGAKVKWMPGYNKTTKTNIDERIWKYTVSDKGVYNLTWAKSQDLTGDINNGKAYIEESTTAGAAAGFEILIDEDTIFVDTMNDKSYVGYSAVPNVENATMKYVLDKYGVADIVYILKGDIYDKDSTYFVLTKDTHDSLKYDGKWYREYFYAHVNGEKETLNIAYNALSADEQGLKAGVLYKALKTVDEDYITKVEVVSVAPEYVGELAAVGNNSFRLNDGTTYSNTVKFDTDADTQYVIVEAVYDRISKAVEYKFNKWNVTDGDISDLKEIMEEAEKYTVAVVAKTNNTADLVYAFVGKDIKVTETGVVLDENSKITGVEIKAPKDLKYGDEIIVILTGKENDSRAAASAFKNGTIYSVVINGQTCYGVADGSGKLEVVYKVLPSDVNGALSLNIGTVLKETTMTADKGSLSAAAFAAKYAAASKALAAVTTVNDKLDDMKADELVTGKVDKMEVEDSEIAAADQVMFVNVDAKPCTDTGYSLKFDMSYNENKDTEGFSVKLVEEDVYRMAADANEYKVTLTVDFNEKAAKADWAVKFNTLDSDIESISVAEFDIDEIKGEPKTETETVTKTKVERVLDEETGKYKYVEVTYTEDVEVEVTPVSYVGTIVAIVKCAEAPATAANGNAAVATR